MARSRFSSILAVIFVSLSLVLPAGCRKKKPPEVQPRPAVVKPAEKPVPPKPAPESMIPAEAIFVLDVPNVSTLREKFKETALYSIYKEESVQELISAVKSLPKQEGKSLSDKLGPPREDFEKAFKKRLTVALLRIKEIQVEAGEGAAPSEGEAVPEAEEAAPQPKKKREFRLVLLAEPSAGDTGIEDLLAKAKEKSGLVENRVRVGDVEVRTFAKDGSEKFACTAYEGLFLLTVPGTEVMADVLAAAKGEKPSIGSETLFNETRQEVLKQDSLYFAFLNCERLFQEYGGVIPGSVDTLFDSIGFKSVRAFGASSVFTGAAMKDSLFIAVPEPKKGFFAALSGNKVPEDAMKNVPAGVVDATVMEVNFSAVWQTFKGTMQAMSALAPGLEKQWNRVGDFESRAGIDFAQWLSSLSTHVTTYAFLPEKGSGPMMLAGGFKPEQVSVIIVADVSRFTEGLDALHNFLPSTYAPTGEAKGSAGSPQISFNETEYNGQKTYTISGVVPGRQAAAGLSYSLLGEKLILASDIDHVRAAIDRYSEGFESIDSVPAFAELAKQLPGEKTYFHFADMGAGFGFFYEELMPLFQLQASAVPNPTVRTVLEKLPPKEAFTNHLFPMGVAANVTEKGIRLESYGPISTNAVFGAATGLVLAIPIIAEKAGVAKVGGAAVGKVPGPSPETEKVLKDIGVGLHLYAKENNGDFPATLQNLVPRHLDDEVALQSPEKARGTGIGFGYVSGLRYDLSDERIVVYDLRGNLPEGRYILSANGQVRYLSEEEFQKRMAEEGAVPAD